MNTSRAYLLVKNGLVVTAEGISRKDILVRDGRVAALQDAVRGTRGEVIDARGSYVLPGILDVHTHPVYLDDMGDLSITAAHGGVTTVIHYAYAKPGEGLLDTLRWFRAEGENNSVLDFALHGGLFDPQTQASDIPAAVAEGVTSFKMFMTYAKLKWMTNDYQLMRTLDIIASVGGLGMVHAENGLATDYLEDKFREAGRDPAEVFEATRPGVLEGEAVNRAVAMAHVAGCPMYIPHISATEALDAIRVARQRGHRVYAETCPQYLTLTGEEIARQGPLAKIGPPLRGPADQRALWQGLADGTIDVVASDHAPKGKRPEDGFFEAPYGAPQVETMLAMVYHRGVNGGWISLPRLVQTMCENPARIFGLYPKKGALREGSDGDLVVFDPTDAHIIRHATQHSCAPYTLYEGQACLGRPRVVVQRGKIIVQDGELLGRRGRGVFLRTRARWVDRKLLVPKGGLWPSN